MMLNLYHASTAYPLVAILGHSGESRTHHLLLSCSKIGQGSCSTSARFSIEHSWRVWRISTVKIHGTHFVQTFVMCNCSCKMEFTVPTISAICSCVVDQSAITSFSTAAIDCDAVAYAGAPLRGSSSLDCRPRANSVLHLFTVCNDSALLLKTAHICLWISVAFSPFSMKNLMTTRIPVCPCHRKMTYLLPLQYAEH